MIVTVTPNPAIDVTIDVPVLRLGASHVIEGARRRAGGKGLNVARVLAQTGHDAVATGPVGADDLGWFITDLAGVDVRMTPCATATRSTYAVVEAGVARTTQLNERGTARTAAEWEAVLAAVRAALPGARCLTISGSLPPATPADVVPRLIRAAQDAGVRVVADLTGDALLAAAAAGADILKPNRDELAATIGTDDPEAGAAMLQDAGARLVLVSLGEDGLVAVRAPDAESTATTRRSGRAVHARLPRPLRGNATGAGDAAVAAVAACLDEGLDLSADLDELVRRAAAWSAAAVLAPLAGALDPSHPELAAAVELRHD
jgi:1-phosphofructokinase family hexose kinase